MKREKERGVEREEVRREAEKREEGEDREGRVQRWGAHASRHSRAALPQEACVCLAGREPRVPRARRHFPANAPNQGAPAR